MPGDFVEFEVVFDDDPVEPAKPPRSPRKQWGLRRWGVAAVGCALVAAAGVVGQGSQAAARAELLQAGDLVMDLRVPRQEVWRIDGQPIGAIGDLLLVEGESTLVAVDLRSGEEVWAFEGFFCTVQEVGRPDVSSGSHLWFASTVVPIEPDRARVMCHNPDDEGSSTVVLDARGAEVLSIGGSDEGYESVSSVGEYIVAADRRAPYPIRVWSMRTGAEVWFHNPDSEKVGAAPRVSVDLKQVTFSGRNGSYALDLATGEPATPGSNVILAGTLCDGGTIESRMPDDRESSVVVLDDGQVRWERSGLFLRPIDDPLHSCDLVPLTEDTGAGVFVDIATGETVFEDRSSSGMALELGDLLVLWDFNSEGMVADVRAHDLRSGAELWSVPADLFQTPITDGLRLVLVEGHEAVIRDLRSGAEVSAWDLPGVGPSYLRQLPDGMLAQVTENETIVLEP